MGNPLREQDLFEKIRTLPEEKVAEVEDFVDFLRSREEDRQLVQAASLLSEDALREVWDNADDAEYDRL
jgi:erythromycin esterase-like protein